MFTTVGPAERIIDDTCLVIIIIIITLSFLLEQ